MKKNSQRKRRVRAKIAKVTTLPRLSVFRSNKYLYAQVIDDVKRETLAAVSDKKTAQAFELGELLAKKTLAKKIKKVVFDRGAYKYHGKIKALAEGARKGGLEF